MKLKKIIALVLLIIFAITALPVFAQEDTTATIDVEKYSENVKFISGLGIYSFADEKPDMVVSREEFAKMVADLLGINGDYNVTDNFTDVLENSTYATEISAMANLGIMNGVGNGQFSPTAPITYTQAIKTIVTALGYKPAADVAGGYSDGYMRCAYDIGIIKNAPYDFNAPLTFDVAANLIRLSSEAEVYDVVYLTPQKAYFASKEDIIVLNVYHDIYLGEGIMTDNGITAINGPTTLASDCIKIGKKVFTGANENEREFLGLNVEYYYRADDNALLHVWEKKGRNDVVRVHACDLEVDSRDFTKTCLVVKEGRKLKKYQIDLYADLIYNGALDETFNVETLKIKDGSIELIDSDRDGDYELIKVEEYRDVVFKTCNTDTKKISATYAEDEYAFINYGEYKNVVFTNAVGEDIPQSSIAEGNVVSVFKSKNKEKIRFVVSEEAREIVADSVETDELGEISLYHEENIYKFSDTYKTLMLTKPVTFKGPEIASSYKIYLNFEGNVAMIIKTEGKLRYAYLLAAGKTGSGLNGGEISVKLLLESNDVVTIPVSDKLVFDGVKNKSGKDILSSGVIFDSVTGNIKPQLVMIRISSDGKLKELDTATDNRNSVFGFDIENFSLDFASESAYSPTAINGIRTYNGNHNINAQTKIFEVRNTTKNVEETNEELVQVLDYSTYSRRYGSSYIKLYDSDEGWLASAIVVSEPLDYQSRLFVVTESFMQKDFDGEFKQAINGWWTQDFRSFVESHEGIFENAVKTRYPNSDGKLKPGDVLEIGFDSDETVNRARMVYSPLRDNDPDYCFFDMNGQSSINDDSNYYILGYPCFISADRIGTYSKANADYTMVSGSKGTSSERYWTTILQAPTGSMSVFEFDCETQEVKIISWDKIPTSGQLTSNGYENFNPDTKVLLKRSKGTTYDVMVVTNLSKNY